jgi:hypothetical protein
MLLETFGNNYWNYMTATSRVAAVYLLEMKIIYGFIQFLIKIL